MGYSEKMGFVKRSIKQLLILFQFFVSSVLFAQTNLIEFAQFEQVLQTNQIIESLVPNYQPREISNYLELQIALDRLNISPGALDGLKGSNMKKAVRAFQKRYKLEETGEFDGPARDLLRITPPVYTQYTVTSNDLTGYVKIPDSWLEKSKLVTMDYQSFLEKIAEQYHSTEDLVRRMNLGIDWENLEVGTVLALPNIGPMRIPVRKEKSESKVAKIFINLEMKVLYAYDAGESLVFAAPCSIASNYDKRPRGNWLVKSVTWEPYYHFKPSNFPESKEALTIGTNLTLPCGPNNPVGLTWIGLSKNGYGIHGTPEPQFIGKTFSHGCIRLTNWDALKLASMLSEGVEVEVVDK